MASGLWPLTPQPPALQASLRLPWASWRADTVFPCRAERVSLFSRPHRLSLRGPPGGIFPALVRGCLLLPLPHCWGLPGGYKPHPPPLLSVPARFPFRAVPSCLLAVPQLTPQHDPPNIPLPQLRAPHTLATLPHYVSWPCHSESPPSARTEGACMFHALLRMLLFPSPLRPPANSHSHFWAPFL